MHAHYSGINTLAGGTMLSKVRAIRGRVKLIGGVKLIAHMLFLRNPSV